MKVCTVCGSEWPDDTNFCPNDGAGLRPVQGTDLVGTVVADRYQIIKKLGEGGMGAVYLGEHVKMHRLDAIKVLTRELAHSADAVARFNREAANAARITHPNVCAIYDFGETGDGLIYLAMEYIEGETLNELLRREGRLGPRRAAAIIAQAADALQAAHDLGIVHRDLKPDNMMLTQARDGSDHIKVVDFGIAKATGRAEDGQKVTKTGLVIGTPEYMSPEQLSGDVLDGRSDVYSLALVFYRALTGRLPFEADTAQEVLIARLTDEPKKLRDAAPDLVFPPQLQAVFDRALQRMPGDRYATAAAFGQDGMAAVRDMPESATPSSTDAATQLVRPGEREVMPPTRLSPASTPVTPQPLAATRPSGAARPRDTKEGRKKPVLIAAAAIGILAVVGGGATVVLQSRGDSTHEAGPASSTTQLVTRDTAIPSTKGNAAVTQTESLAIDTGSTTGGGEPANPEHTAQQGGTDRGGATDTRTDPLPPRVDPDAIAQDLVEIGRRINEPAQRLAARNAALALFHDDLVPDTLRARAASIIAESYDEDHDNQPANACGWIARAVGLDPSNDVYRQFQTVLLECAP